MLDKNYHFNILPEVNKYEVNASILKEFLFSLKWYFLDFHFKK